jgi:beta-1,4-mannosyl-glycoprotein beta-1,4-N-acetylglucosaminyltransferase
MALYDGFMFFNELDLLEIRLHELAEVVDRFIVVEGTETFSGAAKPLYFADNQSRFKPFLKKITHIVVNDMPSGGDPWPREIHSRNAIVRGLYDASPTDLVMVSDVDEIPSAQAIRSYHPETGPAQFAQLYSYYFINCLKGIWNGTRITTVSNWHGYGGAQRVRLRDGATIEQGGWHSSYLGGIEAIRAKIAAYSHLELNTCPYTDPAYLFRVIMSGLDPFGRDETMDFVELDERFPKHVLDNRGRFEHLIRDAVFHERWYPPEQLHSLMDACREVPEHVHGRVVEVGCWEGRSTVALANACWPAQLIAVDTWQGNTSEGSGHVTVLQAAARNVREQFCRNIAALTRGNVRFVQAEGAGFFATQGAVRFCHLDAGNDYPTVRSLLLALLQHLSPGGIVCGNNIQAADSGREDLQGGVERAVRELLPGFQTVNNFWKWIKPP